MIRYLLEDGTVRQHNRHEVTLFMDGLPANRTLFPQIFSMVYYLSRQGRLGSHPNPRYHILRTVAHVQIVKNQKECRRGDGKVSCDGFTTGVVITASLNGCCQS